MIIKFDKKAEKNLRRLPLLIQKKFHRQMRFLLKDLYHRSLYTKKLGNNDIWEARIDYHYRFTFDIQVNIIRITAIGRHDAGLGKK